jgi:3'-phosphoadenosine 5'-phosphosulfate sulfotransferase (PAPS reductase)/FAD synthetase
MAFWTEKDVWEYIRMNNLTYASIYDKGEKRTGCCFCMFGINKDGVPNRFQRMADIHPELYNYCMNKLGIKDVLTYLDIPYLPTGMIK